MLSISLDSDLGLEHLMHGFRQQYLWEYQQQSILDCSNFPPCSYKLCNKDKKIQDASKIKLAICL